ncbi:hypothetical protein A0H81_13569 [Grifola frondosa]|uniref:VPS9 domain-containing protein n=1 Tax=Grifola frondosa TaxID=5627 RepID=A0A1C7LR62_GRIFR|nr:hypothetical protein A0H81_13569 [Grifola frondosa]
MTGASEPAILRRPFFSALLFLPPSSDDASHDEALSSRIAAVNLLDLGLGHLGVDVGASGEEVNALITACGQTLMQLDSVCRAPADKAAVLVSVHKILVDGLSKLPPLTLKSEDEILDEKTPRAASFGRYSAEEEEDSNAEAQTSSPAPINTELTERDVPPPPAVVLSPEEETPSTLLGMEPSASTSTVTPRSVADASASATPESTRTSSPLLTVSAPDGSPTPVSGDIILPLMIFAVVKANPPHLVSHLLFTQRFRRERAAGGEEGYCLINLMAVAEFLENVDLAALGLGESEKMVISTAELTPIPLARSALGTEPTSPRSVHSTIRGRVEQQVDAIAGSANKVISGVVDTSFGVLRALLPGQTAPSDGHTDASATSGNGELQEAAPRPGFGLLRRDTGFSIASLAASLPGASGRLKPAGQGEEAGQQMVEVPSRPGSVRSVRGVEDSTSEDEEGSSEDEDYEEEEEEHDTRSIRSFESMMSSRSRQRRKRKVTNGRKSITDRLASMPGLLRLSQSGQHEATKGSPPGSRRSSLLLPPAMPGVLTRYESPVSSRAASPIAIRISPPNPRFLTCSEDDIKVSEVGELLREYKRLAEAVRAMGGFHE